MKLVSRRNFIGSLTIGAILSIISGCTKTVTKYRPDGTPYTEEEEDWVQTLAAIFVGLIVD